MKKLELDDIFNCILGGAIGDALGGAVRDLPYDVIISQYGKSGLTGIEVDCDGKARITANTQLNIFSIDALVKAYTKYYIYGDINLGRKLTYTNYLRWQYYQNRKIHYNVDIELLKDNYLYSVQELKYERYAEQRMKDILETGMLNDDEENSDNFNNGFAALTKTVPYGIFFHNDYQLAFDMAVKLAKLTHGHPNAYLSCGVLAVIVASIANGEKLEKAIQNGIDILKQQSDNNEVMEMIAVALKNAKEKTHYPEKFEDFGLCDHAHEVLAAAIYVCLIGQDSISNALLFAVNNSGYGNNIATVVGQILGLYLGLDNTCIIWSQKIELYDLLKDISYDLYRVVNKSIPNEIEDYDKELAINEMKYVNIKNISNWWLIKYDKI